MEEVPVAHLLGVSRSALKDIRLRKLALSADIRKQLLKLAEEWAERRAEAMLIEWLDEHGEELLVVASAPAEPPSREGATDEARKTETRLTAEIRPPVRYEHWRSEQRHARRRRTA
jgi:hypothetical protein